MHPEAREVVGGNETRPPTLVGAQPISRFVSCIHSANIECLLWVRLMWALRHSEEGKWNGFTPMCGMQGSLRSKGEAAID